MLPGWLIVVTSFGYLSLLFAIAYFADRRGRQGHPVVNNPTVYALSIAVYCTAWTFYGSVGRAVSSGAGFLPIYLGPTLMFALGWVVIFEPAATVVHHHGKSSEHTSIYSMLLSLESDI